MFPDDKVDVVHTFDRVFGPSQCNSDVYREIGQPLVESVMKGFNGTLFAYGQTASGKTHTMMGTDREMGLIPLAVKEVFNIIENVPDREYLLRISYLEIYNENLHDLMKTPSDSYFQSLQLRENSDGEPYVQDLTEQTVCSMEAVMKAMQLGERHRHIGCTNLNARSSRSHTIFKMVIESRVRGEEEDNAVTVSHLNLVDLAGSERTAEARTTGERFREGNFINTSLMALSRVISMLSRGEHARCIKCKAILKTPTGTTTTLVCHLKRHPDAYQAYMEERQARTNTAKLKSVSMPSQPSVADSFKQKMKPTGPRAKHITKMIANFIARGMHPYSVVEEGGFVDMVAFAMPDYSVPSRTTFSRAVIPNLYESKKKEVKRKLQEIFSRGAECYSLTTDGWTSRANDSYVCLTVHVMDKDFGQHVLQPLEQATTDLSGDSYPTLSQVIPLLHCTRLILTQHSTDEAASLASSLLRSIGARFPDFKMSRLPALAMLVDPSTGLGYLPEDSVWGVFSSLSSAACRKTGQQGADEAAEYLKSPLLARTEDPLLTRILQNSLGGNAHTAIVCTVTPSSVLQTSCTLRFASSAKKICNRPVVNEVVSDSTMMRRYHREIQTLRQKMKAMEDGTLTKTLQEKDSTIESLSRKVEELERQLVWRFKRRETWGGSRPRSALPVLCMAPALPVLKPPRTADTLQPCLDLSTIEELPETTGTSATRSSTGLPDPAYNTSFEGKSCAAAATMLRKRIDLPSSC
ncbi:hypothetical protein HPB47_012958 [Ixodes persulcatus]|uniref:Uncharacterized protein n=1 Tax=Ixodes persulcatus TaxID=34615 RepID=A0AC60NS54_IXOPE|nr:hypothetical protein HPB47_012958 [Ixodes persulcatus]